MARGGARAEVGVRAGASHNPLAVPNDAHAARPERRADPVAIGLALVVVAAYVAHVAAFWTQINDDAFITFRYSRFLSGGLGPYYNVGEHVEGYTNALLMLLCAASIALFGPGAALLTAKLIGAASGLVAIFASRALCRAWLLHASANPSDPGAAALDAARDARLARRSSAAWASRVSWAAGALVALDCAYALNSVSGLETALFSALVMLGLLAASRPDSKPRFPGAGAAFALAAWTRPEGAVLFAAVVLGRLVAGAGRRRETRAALGLDVAIVTGAVALHSALRYALYDGELLPNTYYAKQGGFVAGISATRYVWDYLTRILAGVVPLLALTTQLGGARLRAATLPALAAALASLAILFHAGSDWMLGYRLLTPLTPAWAALAVAGLAAPASTLSARLSRPVVAASAAILPVGLFLWQTPTRDECLTHSATRARGYLNGHTALADWLHERAAPGETVALMDIGIVGYHNPELHILDISGLTDRAIAKSTGGLLDKNYDPAYVLDQEPRFIVIVASGPPGTISQRELEWVEPWTNAEARLMDTEAFRRDYVALRPAPGGADALAWLAAALGAERVFRHDYPGQSYLLVAYERRGAGS